MVHWHEKLQDYNFKILHIPRKTNMPADMLSWPNGQDIQESTKEVSLIPPEAFIQIFGPNSDNSLELWIVSGQQRHRKMMEEWAENLPIQELDGVMWKDVTVLLLLEWHLGERHEWTCTGDRVEPGIDPRVDLSEKVRQTEMDATQA